MGTQRKKGSCWDVKEGTQVTLVEVGAGRSGLSGMDTI